MLQEKQQGVPYHLFSIESKVEKMLESGENSTTSQDFLKLRHLIQETKKALSEQRDFLTVVFENSPYISLIVNSAGRVHDINRAGTEFSGLEKGEVLDLLGGEVFGCINSFRKPGCGRNEECTDCPVRSRVAHTASTGESIHSGEGQMTFVRGKQSIQLDIMVSTTPIVVEQEDMVLVTILDTTDQKKIEKELHTVNKDLKLRIEEIEYLQEQLREEAIRDPLTNLHNRRYLQETLERELSRAQRKEIPVSLILLDIDHFKKTNDEYGHPGGDKVLRELGKIIMESIRLEDISCRYGGEEFLLVLPDASSRVAKERAEFLRKKTENLRINFKGRDIQVTISSGVSCYPTHGQNADELIAHADHALYQAKQRGRNQVVLCK